MLLLNPVTKSKHGLFGFFFLLTGGFVYYLSVSLLLYFVLIKDFELLGEIMFYFEPASVFVLNWCIFFNTIIFV